LAQQDVGAATRTIERLNERIFWIAETGFSGVARDRLAKGLRLLLVGNYGVYYRLNETHIIVLRVLRGGRNITTETFEDL
jgi:toxin ParE1/3/4